MSAHDPQAREFGTKDGGFRISTQGVRTLRLEAWGYWPPEVAALFAKETEAACRAAGSPLEFSMVATALKPQGDAGQEALRAVMQCLSRMSLASARIAADNILTRMQLTRIASSCGVEGKLKFESIPT